MYVYIYTYFYIFSIYITKSRHSFKIECDEVIYFFLRGGVILKL